MKRRWIRRKNETPAPVEHAGDVQSVFDRLDMVVINLDSRPDRLEKFTREMSRFGLENWTRLSAVNGRKEFPDLHPVIAATIGCSLSHISAVQQAEERKSDGLLICEDDLEFLVDKETLAFVITEFLEDPRLDVLAIQGSARGGSHHISPNLRIVVGFVGAACYIVKPHVAPYLSDLLAEGVALLRRGRQKGKNDIIWNQMQKRNFFFASPIGSFARQTEDYSDIEGRHLGPR